MGIGIVSMLLFSVASSSQPQWIYQQEGTFPDLGPCDSAVRIGNWFAVACRLGIWSGPAQDLQLVVPCVHQPDRPNRIRVLDQQSFVASTPCGLFVIPKDGRPRRLPYPVDPGALAADGKGRAVVASGSGIWLIKGPDVVERVCGTDIWEDDAIAPVGVDWVGDWLLIHGATHRLTQLQYPFSGTQIGVDGFVTLLPHGNLLLVDGQGRATRWKAGVLQEQPLDRQLQLFPFEHVLDVVSLGGEALLLLTERRWFFFGVTSLVSGFRPWSEDPPTVVRGDGESVLPWLIANGRLFCPTLRDQTREYQACAAPAWKSLLQQSLLSHGLTATPPPPTGRMWVPRLEVLANGGQVLQPQDYFEGGSTWKAGNRWSVGVRLSWDLGDPQMRLAQLQHESFRSEQNQNRQALERRLVNLLQYRQAVCEGAILPQGDPNSLITEEEMEAQLQFLVSGGSERS